MPVKLLQTFLEPTINTNKFPYHRNKLCDSLPTPVIPLKQLTEGTEATAELLTWSWATSGSIQIDMSLRVSFPGMNVFSLPFEFLQIEARTLWIALRLT